MEEEATIFNYSRLKEEQCSFSSFIAIRKSHGGERRRRKGKRESGEWSRRRSKNKNKGTGF